MCIRDRVTRITASPGAKLSAPLACTMADVVADSTQHLHTDDLQAMVAYLQSLAPPATPAPAQSPREARVMDRGRQLYADHCVACHGAQGQGRGGTEHGGSFGVCGITTAHAQAALTQLHAAPPRRLPGCCRVKKREGWCRVSVPAAPAPA